MRKMKMVLVLLLVLGLSASLMAQGIVDKGIKAGLNFANLTGDDVEDYDAKMGLAVGGYLTYKLNENITIQPELLFTSKGAKMEETMEEEDEGWTYEEELEMTICLNYIEIPILARYDVNTAGNMKPYIMAGPAVAFNISATGDAEYSLKVYDEDGDLMFDESGSEEDDLEDIKALDLGLVFGGGVMFNKFSVDARYEMGLTSIDDTDEDFDIKNSVLSLMVGYSF